MAHLHRRGLAFLWNAIATSAHRTPVPASIRSTGRTQTLSIHKGILAFLPVPRLPKNKCNRSASPPDAHSRSQISRSKMDVRQTSRIAASGLFSVLSMGRAFQFVTMPASLHSVSDTDAVQVSELTAIQVFEDFLRKVWRDKIVFRRLNTGKSRPSADWAGRCDRRRSWICEISLVWDNLVGALLPASASARCRVAGYRKAPPKKTKVALPLLLRCTLSVRGISPTAADRPLMSVVGVQTDLGAVPRLAKKSLCVMQRDCHERSKSAVPTKYRPIRRVGRTPMRTG